MLRRTAFLFLVVLTVGACGGASDDEQIRGVFAQLESARAQGDAHAACERLVTVQEREGSERAPEGEEGEREDPVEEGEVREGECETAFARTLATARSDLRSYHQAVHEVEVEDDHAVAHVQVEAERRDGTVVERVVDYDLARRDGSWRIVLYPE